MSDVSGELARRISRRQFLFGGRNRGGGGSEAGVLGTFLGAAGLGVGVMALGSPKPTRTLDELTISGGIDDQFLRATGATTFAFEAVIFARGGTVLSPAVQNIIVWQARFPCTVTQVRGYRVGGTGATINSRRNGASNHLSSALSLTSADTWMDGGAVQNTAYVADDKLEIMVVSVTGSPTQVSIQVNYTRP